MIRAIAELKKTVPDIRCIIIGDGPERKKLELQTTNYELQTNVRFLGSVPYENIAAYMAEAAVFARPSRSEGLGISFLDALAAGVPIVGTAVGGIPDIICDGETGLFAKVDDHIDLAEKIKTLLTDKQLASRIVAEGQKYIKARFAWQSIADQYRTLFTNAQHSNILQNVGMLVATGIYPPDIGGPATYSKLLFEELPKLGISVEVLSFGEVRRYPVAMRHFLYFLKVLWHGRRADIIFAQDPVSVGLPAALVALVLRKTFLLKIVGDYAWEQGVQRYGVGEVLDEFLKRKYSWRVELFRKIQRWTARRAKKIIVPSEYLKRVVTAWGIDAKKISVVYNAIDFADIGISKEEARAELGISGRVLLSAGRLVPWKGFDVLIDMMPKLLAEFPDLKLIIVGDGPDRESLKRKAYSVKQSENIIFTGSLPKNKLLTCLRASDIFVLNTSYEGFSHQIPEAMAIGVPVITTKVGGNPEVITDGSDGFLVALDDKNAFHEKISLLFRFHESYNRIVEHGIARAQIFNKERMINGAIAVFKTL